MTKTITTEDGTRIFVQSDKKRGTLLVQFDNQSQGEFGVYLKDQNHMRDFIKALLDGVKEIQS